ncbi:MAG: diaminopimelate epimerase [Dehalococcoidia bacterium]|nr:diaminopimelate epimerase [Dehalococcoidia bacterium]
MKFTKMHGTGNDFVLVDAPGLNTDWDSLARAMCDRHFGVGSDGLLLLSSHTPPFPMRMFNPDGSEAEACGNGLRCLGKYLVDSGLAAPSPINVTTPGGPRTLHPEFQDGRICRVRVSMGAPRFKAEEIPLSIPVQQSPILEYPVEVAEQPLRLTFVNMGNPHAICFVQDVAAFPLTDVGPLVEHHPLFPQRINFEVVTVVDRGHLRARVWERGAGETLSCGSGACAVAVAARLQDKAGSPVEVALPGGTLTLRWEPGGQVELSGPAATVFEGDWKEEAS